jgi:hypothetical protein
LKQVIKRLDSELRRERSHNTLLAKGGLGSEEEDAKQMLADLNDRLDDSIDE